jgi:hypothetical protein
MRMYIEALLFNIIVLIFRLKKNNMQLLKIMYSCHSFKTLSLWIISTVGLANLYVPFM